MTSRVIDAVDELAHVSGEMILGRNFGRCGNGRFSVTEHDNNMLLRFIG